MEAPGRRRAERAEQGLSSIAQLDRRDTYTAAAIPPTLVKSVPRKVGMA